MRAWWTALSTLIGDARRRPGPAIGGLLATAVGVGVFVAIALAGRAARSSFTSAVDAVSGRATHEITALGGVDEERLPDFAAVAGVAAAQPSIEGTALVVGVRRPDAEPVFRELPPLRLLGIDPFLAAPFLAEGADEDVVPLEDAERFLLEPATAFLSRRWFEDAGLAAGDRLILAVAGRRTEIEILGAYDVAVLEEGARDTALVDVATAQELLSRIGRLDRISLLLDPEIDESSTLSAIEATLAPEESLGRPERRGERLARLVDAFRLNLLALAGLALVVGSLLVFGSAQFSVVRRNALLGQLRSLGTSRRTLLAAVATETALAGLVGGLAGLALGHLLARSLVGPVGQTVSDLYAFVRVELGGLSPVEGGLVVLGATVLALVAGAFPAIDAASTPPRFVGVRSRDEEAYRLQLPRLLVFGLAGCGLAVVAILWPTDRWWPGFFAAFCVLGIGAVWMPPILGFALPRLRRLGERAGLVLAPMAAGAVSRSLSRTGASAGGLSVALAMMIGVIVMVGSFRVELDAWIAQAIRADVFVADASQRVSREDARVPPRVVEELGELPGLRGIDTLRSVEIPIGDRSAPLMGVRWALRESRRFELTGGDPDTAFDRALAGDLLISEPLARHHDLEIGDVVPIPARSGTESLEIVGVFRDYSSDRGLLVTGADRLIELFGDPGVRNVALWFEDDVELEPVVKELRDRWAGRYALEIRSNREIRREVADIFERTFAVTWVLQLIAIAMALAGVAVTLYGLLLERRRELATLRALGMRVRDLGKLFSLEAFFLVAFPAALALPLGLVLARILTDVINVRSFGWTIRTTVPWDTVLLTLALALVAGLAASLLPMSRVRRLPIATVLREE